MRSPPTKPTAEAMGTTTYVVGSKGAEGAGGGWRIVVGERAEGGWKVEGGLVFTVKRAHIKAAFDALVRWSPTAWER